MAPPRTAAPTPSGPGSARSTDPEIPVISVVDLGIVRDVWSGDGDELCVVTITPTYSGCPAMQVIADAVHDALQAQGIGAVRAGQPAVAGLDHRLDERGRPAALHGYGIAPPAAAGDRHQRPARGRQARLAQPLLTIACPHCGSEPHRS